MTFENDEERAFWRDAYLAFCAAPRADFQVMTKEGVSVTVRQPAAFADTAVREMRSRCGEKEVVK